MATMVWRRTRTTTTAVVIVSLALACGRVGFDLAGSPGGGSVVEIALTVTPAAVTSSADATFEFAITGGQCETSCRVDVEPATPCTSPWSRTGLADGEHTFGVTGETCQPEQEDPPTAGFVWRVDTDEPDTVITAAPLVVSTEPAPAFEFDCDEAACTFECSMNGAAFTPCTTPYSGAAVADRRTHNFRVRAVDEAGNTDRTPAAHDWYLDADQPSAGDEMAAWTTRTALPVPMYEQGVAVHGDFVYITGGQDSVGRRSEVAYAAFNPDGSLGAWTSTSALPVTVARHTSVAHSGYLYVVGGLDGATVFAECYVAPIQADGSLGAWAATAAMSSPRWNHAAVLYNGVVYAVGGHDGTARREDVEYAAINGDGSLAGWVTTSSFATARSSALATAYDQFLFVAAGTNGSRALNDVQSAPIETDGSLGTFAPATRLYRGVAGAAGQLAGDSWFVFGGDDATNNIFDRSTVGRLGPGGAVEGWTSTRSIVAAREGLGVASHGGRLYVLGGYNRVDWYDTVHSGVVIDHTASGPPTDLVENGELDNGTRDWTLLFPVAGQGDATFSVDASAALSGTHSARIDVTDGGTERWHVQLNQLLQLAAGTRYEISFRAMLIGAGEKLIDVSLHDQDAPYTIYWEEYLLVVTPIPYDFGRFVFESQTTDDALLAFDVGDDDGVAVLIDTVVVYEYP